MINERYQGFSDLEQHLTFSDKHSMMVCDMLEGWGNVSVVFNFCLRQTPIFEMLFLESPLKCIY